MRYIHIFKLLTLNPLGAVIVVPVMLVRVAVEWPSDTVQGLALA